MLIFLQFVSCYGKVRKVILFSLREKKAFVNVSGIFQQRYMEYFLTKTVRHALGSLLRPRCPCHLNQEVRQASGTVKRERKREMKRQVEVQYASNKADPTDRVYVWGHAATGALGMPFTSIYGQRHAKRDLRTLQIV